MQPQLSHLPAQACTIEGFLIPGVKDVLGEGGQWAVKAELHGQTFAALIGTTRQGDPDADVPPMVVVMLAEALEALAGRNLSLLHPNMDTRAASSRDPVNQWAMVALFGENDLMYRRPETIKRLVLAYGRAGYFKPNAVISPFGPLEPEMPLFEQMLRTGNIPAAEALIELGADIERVPRKTRYDPLPRSDDEVIEPSDEFFKFLSDLDLGEDGYGQIRSSILQRSMRAQLRSHTTCSATASSQARAGRRQRL